MFTEHELKVIAMIASRVLQEIEQGNEQDFTITKAELLSINNKAADLMAAHGREDAKR